MASVTFHKVFLCTFLIANYFCFLDAIMPPPWQFHHNLRSCKLGKVFQFGDSLNDAGNLLREPIGKDMMFSRLPYGETFFKRPTGRCSNGLLIVDFIAWAVGVPFINPYKDTNASFVNGVNFAVAGASALSQQELHARQLLNPQTNDTLDIQVDWFTKYLASICKTQEDCAKKLKDSLFLLGEVGGNDYNYAFMSMRPIEQTKLLVPDVVQAIVNAARRLIQLGASRVVIPGNLPIGCLPIYLTNFKEKSPEAYDEFHCHKGLNEFSVYHNAYLQGAIEELKREGHSATIVYADYYNGFMWMLKNAPFLGLDLTSLQKACCGSGGDYNFDLRKLCGDPGVPVCPDPEKFVSWDGIHLTQKAYEVISAWLVKINITPNIRC